MSIAEKLTQIAENEPKVYEAGRKAEQDEFWDVYLRDARENEATARQGYRFAGSGWNDDTFYPTQDIYVKYGYGMFHYNRVSNIKKRLEDCHVKFNYYGATNVSMMFEGSLTTEIPVIELNKLSHPEQCQRLCYACRELVTIEKIVAVETNKWGNSFNNCSKLRNITFEGVIGLSISFSDSPLTVESMKSIISCLKDYSWENAFTYTLTLSDSCKTALEADTEKVELDGQSYTYFELITAKGWNLA